ncbi:transcription termination factor NusA [Actinotignum sp. GS-2025a]|uniref:transcription termination factor NusA n=1 Tax=Actinotignum TaxID=1653174 RepID=UPI00254FFD8D|nr:transcription termination factor NusA [Actinotignum timonense]MDK6927014.1 transcription termination factor NusA [Actinotignum timonense]
MQIHMNELRALESELGLSSDVLVEAIEDALLHAYARVPGAIRGARVDMDRRTGKIVVWAPEIDEEGNVVGEFDDTPHDFGRIATATAKSVIAQRLKEAEANRVLGSFKNKQGDIISGVVQGRAGRDSFSRDLLVEVGDHEAILRAEEQVPTEHLNRGDRIRALVLDVVVTSRGASIRLSRTHPDFVRRLFELEVPEIASGTVELVALAREAGHRSKLAVYAEDPEVNAKGACIGHNGQRVRAVTTELGGEKIDIVDYNDDPAVFIAASLSPAKVSRVDILSAEKRQARAIVPDGQASLAIGKEAQNVRLAAKLTGWSIDIRKESDVQEASGGDVADGAASSAAPAIPAVEASAAEHGEDHAPHPHDDVR